MKIRTDLILAVVLLISFFLPWSRFFSLQGSGFELALSPQIQGTALFILPALCVFILLIGLSGKLSNRWLRILTGLLPVLGAIGTVFYVRSRASMELSDVFSNLSLFLDWGIYVTLVTSLVMFLHALFEKRTAKNP